MTLRNAPLASSDGRDAAAGRRSSDFGRHHDQWARIGMACLAAKEVEVLRRRRRVDDTDVALRAEGQEPLEPRGRMLRARALVAMRQEQRQPRGLPPLREAGDEELVDDDLGAVHEVPVLRLPQHERLRGRHRVAVLESQRRVLGQRRVVQLERCSRPGEVLQGHVARRGLRVPQPRVSLAEGAAHGVLPGEADWRPLPQERREREELGVAPVDGRLVGVERDGSSLELAGELRMDREAVRDRPEAGVRLAELLDRHRRLRLRRLLRCDRLGPAVELGLWLFRALADRCLALREVALRLLHHRVGFVGGDHAGIHELRLVELADRCVLLDHRVHPRLRVGRLVPLVVAVSAVPDQVDDHVVAEFLAVHHRQASCGEACLGVVGVDVDDRDVEALREIGRVVGGSALARDRS